MRRDTIGIVVGAVAVVALVLATTAFAGKPTSSLELVVLPSGSTVTAATAEPSFGGQVTFDVSTTQSDQPYVNVRCYQDGTWVYDTWQGFYESYVPEPVFTLASRYWTEGAADCTARLLFFDRQGRARTLASTSFHVAA